MNLASFYLCLFFSEAALKCDIVEKEENYKYLVALYTYHFGEGERKNEFAEWHVAWLAE